MKITCIDFETADSFKGSICSVGIAVIEDGKISETRSMLIRPHARCSFSPFNIHIHGITPDMVKDAPEFDAAYETLRPYVENSMLAAHFAAFDVTALKNALALYKIPLPSFDYVCTCELARNAWPRLRNHKLDTVCSHLGHSFKHHDAAEDSIACAEILLKVMRDSNTADIRTLAEKCSIRVHKSAGDEPFVMEKVSRFGESVDIKRLKPSAAVTDTAHAFYGKYVAFTGELKSMDRHEAMQRVVNLGGRPQNNVTLATGYLVSAGGMKSNKVKKACEYNQRGKADIRIIDEAGFVRMLEGG